MARVPPSSLRLLLGPALFLAGLGGVAPLSAQAEGCDLVSSRGLTNLLAGPDNRIVYVSGPVFHCGGGLRIAADSAVVFSATNFSRLLGNVRFTDGPRILTSGRANYFSADGRMVAWEGQPQIWDTVSGTLVEGDTIKLFRASDRRPEDELEVTGGRPHAILYPAPAVEEPEADSLLAADSLATADALAAEDSLALEALLTAGDSLALQAFLATQDSLAQVADSLDQADSLVVVPDSLPPVADSAAPEADFLPDREPLAVPADSIPEGLDSLGVEAAADSAGVAQDPVVFPPGFIPAPEGDSLRRADATPGPDTLRDIDPEGGEPEEGEIEAADSLAAPLADAMDPEVADSLATEPPADTVVTPFDLRAERILLRGESYLQAVGEVEILRDSLEAYADSLEFNQRSGLLELRENAILVSSAFTLSGTELDLVLPGSEIREVQARENAILSGTDLNMTAPQIRLYLNEGALDRMVAVDWAFLPDSTEVAEADAGEGGAIPFDAPAAGAEADSLDAEALELLRPRARARDFLLKADSIEVMAPAQILETVVASGTARGESSARDSLNSPDMPELLRSDWIEGDTITADFQMVAAGPDQAGSPGRGGQGGVTLRRLTAAGTARSLYRLDPAVVEVDSLTAVDSTALAVDSAGAAVVSLDSPEAVTEGEQGSGEGSEQSFRPLPLHFVTGTRIVIEMRNGEVDRMQVDGPARGMYLEPLNRNRPPANTAGAGAGGGG